MRLVKIIYWLANLCWAVGSEIGPSTTIRNPLRSRHNLKEERTRSGWRESWQGRPLGMSGTVEKRRQTVQSRETDQNLMDLLSWLAQADEIRVHFDNDNDDTAPFEQTSSSDDYYDGIRTNERKTDSYWPHQSTVSASSPHRIDTMSQDSQQIVKRAKSPPKHSYTIRPSVKKEPKRKNGYSPAVIHGPSTRYYPTAGGTIQHAMGFSPALSSVVFSIALFAFLSAAVSSGISRAVISAQQQQKVANDLRLKNTSLGGIDNGGAKVDEAETKNPHINKAREAFNNNRRERRRRASGRQLRRHRQEAYYQS